MSSVQSPRRSWTFERGSLWLLDLAPEQQPTPINPSIPAVLTEVSRESADQLVQAMGLIEKKQVLQRLAAGRCFTAWVEGSIAAYCWVSTTHECIGELEHEIHLPPGEAYIWDCATLPNFRGKHLYGALLSYIIGQLRCEGVRRIWIGASLDNQPSLRAFAHAGFQPVVNAWYMRLFNLACLMMIKSPAVPKSMIPTLHQMLAFRQEHAWRTFLFNYSRSIQLPPCLQTES
jgi:ribosomal protein S18 acetylase RimI-like enzyme